MKAPSWPKLCKTGPGQIESVAAGLERIAAVKLRCVGITPRLLSLVALEANDCRYRYGGDKEDEAITFCGHPRFAGSSYCAPHFYLMRWTGVQSESAVGPAAAGRGRLNRREASQFLKEFCECLDRLALI